jgi:hypothetical protein
MNDKDALKIMLAGLDIFRQIQAEFTDPFWQEMCEYLGGETPVDCTWNQIDAFYNRLKEFAVEKQVGEFGDE